MPYKYVEAEKVLDYRGIKIYQAYENDSFDKPIDHVYSFSENGQPHLDIRYLGNYRETHNEVEILREAIDLGTIQCDDTLLDTVSLECTINFIFNSRDYFYIDTVKEVAFAEAIKELEEKLSNIDHNIEVEVHKRKLNYGG